MRSTASRTGMALILAGLLLFGLLSFLIRYAVFSDDWISHSNRSGVASIQQVTDRSGAVLYEPHADKAYSDDALIRRATVHLLGDREGNIDPLMLKQYIPQLVGFDKINGTYGMKGGNGQVELTISASVEAVALQALNGRKGTVGVYNYKTGEILCAVTSPTFDPYNAPTVADDADKTWEGLYLHRFFHSTYTPGSIFKLVTTAAALENIPDIQDQTFTCTGSITVNGEVIHCQSNKTHGTQTLEQALANSCNCAYAQIAQQVGAERLSRKAAQIGITDRLLVDGYWTKAGSFDLSGADANRVAWAGIGQDIDLVNPCQYMTWMGAIANGGKAAEPWLVRRVYSGGKLRYEAKTTYTSSMITRSAASALTDLMHNNVEEMYAPVNFSGVKVCAKSGTAEVYGKENTATFAGFIASDRYPLAFVVIIEEGGSGARACSPVAANVLWACINAMKAQD